MSEVKEIAEKNVVQTDIKEKKRNLGLDILRIISMIMILFLHYLGKGSLLGKTNNSTFYYILYYFFEAISIIVVNCYVLISGYFLVNSKFKWKKVLQLWRETIFYSISIYFFIVVVGLKEFEIKDAIKSALPIITKQYWFVNVYLMMYILSPFLNKLINNLEKKEFQKLLLILIVGFSIVSILPSGYTLDASGGYSIIWFVCLYLISAYIRLYGSPLKISTKKYFIIFILCAVFITLEMLSADVLCEYIGRTSFAAKFLQYNNIIVLIQSLALFLCLKDFDLKNIRLEKIVIFLAPLTFAVYLIHEQPQLRTVLYDKILQTQNCFHNPYSIFIVVFSVLAMFTVCIVIEWIRKKVVKIIKEKNKILNS